MSEPGSQTGRCLLPLTTQYYFDERGSVIPMLGLAHFTAVAISLSDCGAVCWRTINGHVAIRTTIANLFCCLALGAPLRIEYHSVLRLYFFLQHRLFGSRRDLSSPIHGRMHLETMFYFRLQSLAMSLFVPPIARYSSKESPLSSVLVVFRPLRRYLHTVLLCLLQFSISSQVTQRLRQANRA